MLRSHEPVAQNVRRIGQSRQKIVLGELRISA